MAEADLHTRDIAHALKLIKASSRMTAGRKAIIVKAIRCGVLSHARARELYDLSVEELNSWLERDQRFGTRGLAVRKLQELPR